MGDLTRTRVRVQIHIIEPGNCTVYTRELDGAPWVWEAASDLLNQDIPGRMIPLPERPAGEHCDGYHIYADRGLVHDG